ncbi:Sec-independent protein translocase subunit TatA/TatB [Sinomicrobium oceani]|uniref:Sec-independent protein translocase subunit TatA/TatB n=1 Tax=Sinomicrobium oceani TaxID=1150368 RepID=UPI002DD41BD3|nr:twin-arginine translocase TatA/TatE family subunit [Sinomicrobium oceani]
MTFLFIGGPEIFFVIFIVVMVFGADKIPNIARDLGKGMRQLKDTTEDIKREIQKSAERQDIDTSFVEDIKKDIEDVKNNLQSGIGDETKKSMNDIKANDKNADGADDNSSENTP